jgi:photosystem II stability/assembly factor-like uncharacterized protein
MKGWAVGGGGKILNTTDGGVSWGSTTIAGNPTLYNIQFTDSLTGYIGCEGKLLKTIDGGVTWSIIYFDVPHSIRSIDFINSQTGWVTYGYGKIYKTEDWGYSWINHYSSTGAVFEELCFVDSLTAWAVGEAGTVMKTTNGGKNWGHQSINTTLSLTGVHSSDGKTAWITGYGNRIFKTTNGGGITSVEQSAPGIPEEYDLSQNYPNPFNPSTVVNYSLPKGGLVTMKLYDIRGSEVATILNEYKESGNHSLVIETIKYGLSSGVYFYRLTSGNTTITKKMVLLR